VCIINRNNTNVKDPLDCLMFGKKYSLIMDEQSTIYESIIDEGTIFPVNHIPFDLLKYNKLSIVIRDVNITSCSSDICLKFHHIKSLQKYNEIDEGIKIRWPPFGNILQPNYLLFRDGMCGILRTSIGIDANYKRYNLTSHTEAMYSYDILSHLNNNQNNDYVDNYQVYCDEYSTSYVFSLLKSSSDFIMETLKLKAIMSVDTPFEITECGAAHCEMSCDIYTCCDGITNLQILTDVIITRVTVEFNNMTEILEIKKIQSGYEIVALSNKNHLIVVGKDSNKLHIQLNFESNKTDMYSLVNPTWIKFDRCAYSTTLRRITAQQYVSKIFKKNIANIDEIFSSVMFPENNNVFLSLN